MNQPISSPQFVNGTPDWVKPLIQKASQQHNIPTMLLSALLKQESGFNPNARSSVGAQGIAQFMPATARGMGVNALDPESAINGAARYLRNSWDKFGKPELALAAYNAGGGAVSQYGGIPPYKETQNYVKNIMAMSGEPHASFNQPLLDAVNDYKKQSASAKPFTPPQSQGAMMPSQPRPQILAQQMMQPVPQPEPQQTFVPDFGDTGALPTPVRRPIPQISRMGMG